MNPFTEPIKEKIKDFLGDLIGITEKSDFVIISKSVENFCKKLDEDFPLEIKRIWLYKEVDKLKEVRKIFKPKDPTPNQTKAAEKISDIIDFLGYLKRHLGE